LLASGALNAWAADGEVDKEVRRHLAEVRAIVPDSAQVEKYNRQMDEAWAYFTAHRQAAIPVIREALGNESRAAHPNQLVLLDGGYFLFTNGGAADKDAAKSALFAIDPAAEIIRWNWDELFHFAHGVAASGDARILPWLDKAFLRGGAEIFVPQHAMRVDETLACVFLYGVQGTDVESHLTPLLSDGAVSRRVLEVLIWLGSPKSNDAVRKAMQSQRDKETFARAVAFLMATGGPKGRAMLLEVKPKDLDGESRSYYEQIKGDVESTDYDAVSKSLSMFPGDSRLGDDEVRKRLSAMIANHGRDDRTAPKAILDSKLPRDFLVVQLVQVRRAALTRISDEALDDVKVTNALMNALYYRSY
jgi:hypothetical protein